MIRWAAVVVAVMAFPATSSAFAPGHPPCRELPPPAWHGMDSINMGALGISVTVPMAAGAKHLYQQALCGADPDGIWELTLAGRGAIVAIEEPLAVALDRATPHLPRVDYVYVRGGGFDREMVVILFANGYQGPLFVVDEPLAWTRPEVDKAALYWNALPFEFVLRASRWLHDAAKYRSRYDVIAKGSVADILPFEIPISSMTNRALANPLGSMLMPLHSIARDADVWIHELSHYNHYNISGISPLYYVDEFGKISRRNYSILGVAVPGVFEETNPVARAERQRHCADKNVGAPYGYVTSYAYCGEAAVLEDFGDTLTIAVGITHGIVRSLRAGQAVPDLSRYQNGSWNGGYGHGLLFAGRGRELLARKAEYIRDQFSYSLSHPMDADSDGVLWRFDGNDVDGDCADDNPAVRSALEDPSWCEGGTSAVNPQATSGDVSPAQ